MKSVFSVMFLFLCGSANADSLDKVVAKLNRDLNPRAINEIGFEVEYRQETATNVIHTWINISKVKKECTEEAVYYLENNLIFADITGHCINKAVWEPKESPLFQVTCEGLSGKTCRNALSKEVSTQIVKDMIASKIHDAKVR